MTTGKAVRILASGLAGAVVLVLCSMIQEQVMGHNWYLAPVLFGGTVGLIIGYLLTLAQERDTDPDTQVDTCNSDLRKSIQDYQLLAEKHERDKETFVQAQALHNQVFNTMGIGVLVVGKSGEILLVNEPARALLHLEIGFTRESLNAVLPYFDLRSDQVSRNRSVARITLQDGANRLFGFSTSPLAADGGIVVVFEDITVTVENQERKRRSEELALVGEMLSRLSHEIKNPLASILVGVKTLQRGTPQSSDHGHILQLISEEVDSLTKIINHLLDSARPRASFPRPVNVEPLLERCMDAHALLAVRRGVKLELVRFPVPTVIIADEQSMLHVLRSLIDNALDACSKGDLIRIGWRELDQEGKDEFALRFSGKVVSLFVEDNGSGVTGELSSSESRIFKAFVSTKVSGSGLGLTVSRDIVEDNGGVILVDSLVNRGTRVQVLLPVPEGVPCWGWHGDRPKECDSGKGDCASCDVRSSGTGYRCWEIKEQAHHALTGQWPERCLKCGFFRTSRLTPFFKSRLAVSKAE